MPSINDILLCGAMAAAKERGLRVGIDINIIGFYDLVISAVIDPSFWTIRTPENKTAISER